ncbi:MAG: hypothetical protein Kow0074_12150 [Candidatus Zixiibacteriota bacterium]
MKLNATILLAGLLLATAPDVQGISHSSAAHKMPQALVDAATTAPADSVFDVLVSLATNDPTADRLAASAATLDVRYRGVARHLRDRADASQSSFLKQMQTQRFGTRTRVVRRFWISNLVQIQTDAHGLSLLASSPDVSAITDNAQVDLIEPVALGETSESSAAMVNLQAIGATEAWANGWTGKGRLVASIDTGVEGVHPALKNSWRGIHGDTSAAWYDPFDAPAPMDNNGHGTHVMGIMVGRTDTDTIGVAPDAEWINAAVIDRGNSLSVTIADILDALQWVVDPDGNPETTNDVPDVVCNSWGVSQTIINPCDPVFFDAIDNVEAMGIVCIFAAGNEGPNSMSIRNPADRATSPTASFSVGAVDATIAGFPVPSFSSRGPSACDGVSIKPEIAAPGVAIYSSYKGGTYRTMNGTSMAAPFVAGTVALMRQINPNLTPEEIKTILLESATDMGPAGEDNEYGSGLLDLPEALSRVPIAKTPDVTLTGFVIDDIGNAILAPGEVSTLTVEIAIAEADAHNLYGTLAPLTADISVVTDSVYFGTLTAGTTLINADHPFLVEVGADAALGDTLSVEFRLAGDPLLGAWSDTISFVCGLPDGASLATLSGAGGDLTVTNFGHFGAANTSALAAGGTGWTGATSPRNCLYEFSLMLRSADGRFSDASRGSALDFAPIDPVTIGDNPDGEKVAITSYDDRRSAAPLGVRVEQTVTMYDDAQIGRYAVVECDLVNESNSLIPGLQLGYLVDFDIMSVDLDDEMAVALGNNEGFYNWSIGSHDVAGVASLGAPFGTIQYYSNPANGKLALTPDEKLNAFLAPSTEPDLFPGDVFAVVCTAPIDLGPSQTASIALVMVAVDSPDDLAAAINDARRNWQQITDVGDDEGEAGSLPRTYLAQNYPNPFNPETVIGYALGSSGNVRLDVFNVLGQHVRTLVDGWNPAGQMTVVWDGRDDQGHLLASGVYLYRLRTNNASETRKMVLMR